MKAQSRETLVSIINFEFIHCRRIENKAVSKNPIHLESYAYRMNKRKNHFSENIDQYNCKLIDCHSIEVHIDASIIVISILCIV